MSPLVNFFAHSILVEVMLRSMMETGLLLQLNTVRNLLVHHVNRLTAVITNCGLIPLELHPLRNLGIILLVFLELELLPFLLNPLYSLLLHIFLLPKTRLKLTKSHKSLLHASVHVGFFPRLNLIFQSLNPLIYNILLLEFFSN
jgi:hypothetical protein